MSTRSFKVVQWNCNRLKPKLSFMHKVVDSNDIFCLQETWLEPTDNFYMNDFNIYRKDRSSGSKGGGLIIGVRKDL